MICPHCGVGVKFDFTEVDLTKSASFDSDGKGFAVLTATCPECDEFVVLVREGYCEYSGHDGDYSYLKMNFIWKEALAYPTMSFSKPLPKEIPSGYKNDFLEAFNVLPISPKASAALSRRILQQLLHDDYHIKHKNLVEEIEEFLKNPSIPSYVKGAVDAIRHYGNFAAHPTKDINTGEIVEVEAGEAEWLIEVLEALFDITFVQPMRLQEKQKQLNEKLSKAGKPPMKTS